MCAYVGQMKTFFGHNHIDFV